MDLLKWNNSLVNVPPCGAQNLYALALFSKGTEIKYIHKDSFGVFFASFGMILKYKDTDLLDLRMYSILSPFQLEKLLIQIVVVLWTVG